MKVNTIEGVKQSHVHICVSQTSNEYSHNAVISCVPYLRLYQADVSSDVSGGVKVS